MMDLDLLSLDDICLDDIPGYIKNKNIEKKGFWGNREICSLSKIYEDTVNVLQKINDQGGQWCHMMESPARFIGEYNAFCLQLILRLRFRRAVCSWWVKKQFLSLYKEVSLRPGNTEYKKAEKNFYSYCKEYNV